METQFNEVPKMISGKDLDYLSDMFEWNYSALKKTNSSIASVNNEEIKSIMQKACNIFDENLKIVLNILGGSNE